MVVCGRGCLRGGCRWLGSRHACGSEGVQPRIPWRYLSGGGRAWWVGSFSRLGKLLLLENGVSRLHLLLLHLLLLHLLLLNLLLLHLLLLNMHLLHLLHLLHLHLLLLLLLLLLNMLLLLLLHLQLMEVLQGLQLLLLWGLQR